MRVLFLEAVQDHGGARKSTLELAKRLQDKGVEVLVVDFYGTNQDFINDVQSKNLELRVLLKKDKPFIIKDSNIYIFFNNIIRFGIEYFKIKSALKNILHDFKPNYIVVNNRKTLSLVPKSDLYKIIFFARGWFIPEQITKFDSIIMKERVDIYMAVSQSTRQALFAGSMQKLENIHVVSNGIALNEITKFQDNKNDIFTIIHSGGFLPDKGQLQCLEIAKILKNRNLNFKLLLTGKVYNEVESEEYYQIVKKVLYEYNLTENVELIVNHNFVLDLIGKSHILIHPSSTEGLPRVLMEAMALKTVVLANPVGGITDFILDGFTGYLLRFNSIKDYADKIEFLYYNRSVMEDIRTRGFQLIRNCYTADNQVNAFISSLKND